MNLIVAKLEGIVAKIGLVVALSLIERFIVAKISGIVAKIETIVAKMSLIVALFFIERFIIKKH